MPFSFSFRVLTLFFTFLLLVYPAFSADSPQSSPSLPPQLPADNISPFPVSSSPSPTFFFSASHLSPSPAPSPQEDDAASSEHHKSPAPALPATHENESDADDLEGKVESSGGMSSGQKAGVAIGVIAGACIVGAGGFVYKKRQQNIRRSEYGYAARREIL